MSVERTLAIGFEAYAIGGPQRGRAGRHYVLRRRRTRRRSCRPTGPRYLMGVGTPLDIVEARVPRHRPVRLRDAHAQRAERPAVHQRGPADHQERPVRRRTTGRSIRPAPATPAGHYSRAYLRHLFVSGEIGAAVLNTHPQPALLP
ncbi:MAG: hypothetical protein M0C28_13200 [Candidatus Moduliflexus flocculans]|nr:hypothetical protein [Candidatus Moduliflexus flocculans]